VPRRLTANRNTAAVSNTALYNYTASGVNVGVSNTALYNYTASGVNVGPAAEDRC